MGRLRAISSMTETSRPLSRATRREKLSRKSISPRMAPVSYTHLDVYKRQVQGKVVYKPVADAWGLDYEPLTL